MQRGQLDGDTGPRCESFVLGLEEEFEKSEQSQEECQVDRLTSAGQGVSLTKCGVTAEAAGLRAGHCFEKQLPH